MTTLDHSSRAIRRKGYAPHYSTSNLTQFQPEMHDCTLELVNVNPIPRLSRYHTKLNRDQILEGMTSNTPIDCLTLFRHLMVDVFVASSYGYRMGALGRWAADVEDVLCTAIHGFPVRGIIVCAIVLRKTTSCSQALNSEALSLIGLGTSSAKSLIIVGAKSQIQTASWPRSAITSLLDSSLTGKYYFFAVCQRTRLRDTRSDKCR